MEPIPVEPIENGDDPHDLIAQVLHFGPRRHMGLLAVVRFLERAVEFPDRGIELVHQRGPRRSGKDGGSEDEAIAGLLHDTLEDHPELVRPEDIARRYGRRVLSLVEACTDTPPGYAGGEKPPWRERKERYYRTLVENLRRVGPPGRLLGELEGCVAEIERLVVGEHP